MNITVKHIEELVKLHEKKFRVEEVNGKFTITIITDYDNNKTRYTLIKLLREHHNHLDSLKEELSKFIPETLFFIKGEEINTPLSRIETDYFIKSEMINYTMYTTMGVEIENNGYNRYIDINGIGY